MCIQVQVIIGDKRPLEPGSQIMDFLKKLSRGLMASDAKAARGKQGCRAYAVGDIHGRLDLLNQLISRIEDDVAARPRMKTFIVFLGDLVDRGAESAGVVERLRTFSPPYAKPIFLGGNHEEVLLRILAGDIGILPSWLKFGGAECAESYGIDPDALRSADELTALRMVKEKVPQSHNEFLKSFADTFRFGDYLFVHAGIRPGVALEEQDRSDLRWIREPFLTDAKEHGFVIVHGHTIVPAVEERRNRIAIDTGAYRTGMLTAVAIEDDKRWFLTTGEPGATDQEGQPLRSVAA